MPRHFDTAVIDYVDRTRKYGFAITQDGRTVFLHVQRRSRAKWHLNHDDEGMYYITMGMVTTWRSRSEDVPQELTRGERIFFVPRNTRKGPEATYWVFEDHWHSQYTKEITEIDQLRCRVFVSIQPLAQRGTREFVQYLFDGTVGELKQAYPNGRLVDRREGDTYLSYEFYLREADTEEGEGLMLPCLDPRPLP